MSKTYFPPADTDRGRIWEFIQYDDSSNIQEIIYQLKSIGITAAISPLHDHDKFIAEDLDDDDLARGVKPGDYKKAHRHILTIFEGYKSGKQIKKLCSDLKCVKPMLMASKVHRLRYLCHFDELGDENKPFYDPTEVICIGPLDYESECQKAADPDLTLRHMQSFLRETHMLSYAEFMDYCAANNPEWYDVLTKSRTFVIKEYLKSLSYEPKLKKLELEFEIQELRDHIDMLQRRSDQLDQEILKKVEQIKQ